MTSFITRSMRFRGSRGLYTRRCIFPLDFILAKSMSSLEVNYSDFTHYYPSNNLTIQDAKYWHFTLYSEFQWDGSQRDIRYIHKGHRTKGLERM